MSVFVSIGYLLLMSVIAKKVEAITESEKSLIETKVFSFAFECSQTYPLTTTEIMTFRNKIFPDGLNPKCFTACVFKKIGIMDENGMLSPQEAQKKAELLLKENYSQLNNDEDLIRICSAVNKVVTDDGPEGCDRAKLIYECLIENGPKYGLKLDDN